MKGSFTHIGWFTLVTTLLVATGHGAVSARVVRIRNLFLMAIDSIVQPIIVALLSWLLQRNPEKVMPVLEGKFSKYSGKC
jgi:hypothetical protein